MPDLQQFAQNIWLVEGPNVRDMGFTFTTRMTVVKLSDNSLWIESPVPIPPATIERIVALGPIKYLVAATPRHVWRLAEWHAQFPAAQLWAPKPTLVTLEKGHLEFTGILTDVAPQAWAEDLGQIPFRGNPLIEEVIFFHRQARTVIVNDLIQNHPAAKGRPLRNALLKLTGVAYPYGGVPLDMRLSFIHANLARQSLEKLLAWDFDKLIIAHGVCVENNAKAFVERAFHWLV
jgi:hypothetical protein